MSDRPEELRREAARYLAQANATTNPKAREELIRMAARFHELANSVPADFDAIVQAFNDAGMADASSQPVAQQQQQVQPKKKQDE